MIYLGEAFTGVKGSKGYTTKSPLLAIRSSHQRCDLSKVQSGNLSRHGERVLDARLGRAGAGPGGTLDIQDDTGIAESEREFPELIDQDSDGNIRVSSSINRTCRCFCNVTSFLLNLSVLKRNVCLVRISTADTWNRVAVSLVSFNSTSKGRLILSLLVIPSFNRS